MTDETAADDGAIYAFWAFIERVRARPDPPDYAHRLEHPNRFREAVAAFERGDP